jgi:hypothetical protein
MLEGQEGHVFAAIVTTVDQRGLRLQLRDLPVVATVPGQGVPGETLNIRLTAAKPEQRLISFEQLG